MLLAAGAASGRVCHVWVKKHSFWCDVWMLRACHKRNYWYVVSWMLSSIFIGGPHLVLPI